MLRIGIVGGGISGLAAAMALRASGHEVRVFERAPAITEVGSGLTLWANATRALRHLGVLDQCLARSQEIRSFHLRHASGRRLMRIPIESFATTAIAMHRCDLQSALLEALPDSCIQVNRRCLSLREADSGVYLRFEDGEEGPFDVALGADGVRSEVRAHVGQAEGLKYQGYYVWRGVAQLEPPPATAANPYAGLMDYEEGVISETWGRGHRFGILPLGLGRVCWYATANQPLGSASSPDERRGKIIALTSGWHAPIQRLLEATPAAAILENAAFDRDVRGAWSRGAVLLIGDAAHPLTPNLGQGVCMALEDAVVLGEVLRCVSPDKRAVVGALRRFESLRRARVKGIARRCRWLGALGQWEQPVLSGVRNQTARIVPGAYFAHTSRAIQAYAAEQVEAQITDLPASGLHA